MNPFQYTVQSGDYRGLNDIVRRFGFQDYQQAGISAVPSGNFDLIRPGDVINFGNQPRNMPGQNQGIVSTTQYRNDLNSAENSLNEFQNDPYMSLFQKMRDQNKQAEETARLNAEAQANREKVQQEQKFVAGKAGTDSANIAGGLSRYAPELANSQTQQVFTRNLMKIEEIQGEEDLAIARAKDARAANDLDVMREELAYIQQLREAKAEAIAEANKMAFEREKFEEDKRQFGVTEARLRAKDASDSSGSGKSLSILDLDRLEESYGIRLPYGTTQEEAERIIADPTGFIQEQTQQFETQMTPIIQGYIDDGVKSKWNILRKIKKASQEQGDELDADQIQLIKDLIERVVG